MATAFSLLLFVGLANAVVDLYVRGVARAAVDEAARAGAALDATAADCRQRASDLLEGVVAARTIRVTCREVGGVMRATARVELTCWMPGLPTWTFTLAGEVVKERIS